MPRTVPSLKSRRRQKHIICSISRFPHQACGSKLILAAVEAHMDQRSRQDDAGTKGAEEEECRVEAPTDQRHDDAKRRHDQDDEQAAYLSSKQPCCERIISSTIWQALGCCLCIQTPKGMDIIRSKCAMHHTPPAHRHWCQNKRLPVCVVCRIGSLDSCGDGIQCDR